jgi:ubiquinone/menaquinone biosynthesis C-methylase UbiE
MIDLKYHFIDIQKKYWDELATKVNNDISVNHWINEKGYPVDLQLFKEIALFLNEEFLQNKSNVNILEIGCGNGLILKQLKILNNNFKLYGCDISDKMLSKIKLNCTLYNCDAKNIPCNDNSFDLIYLNSVIQYFDNEQYFKDVISKCLIILKPTGSICLMDVPLTYYQEYMTNQGLKYKLGKFGEKYFNLLLNLYRKNRKIQYEIIDGVKIIVPEFRGYWLNPDILEEYNNRFEKISIELQTFKNKPIIYKKFRFNVMIRNKI